MIVVTFLSLQFLNESSDMSLVQVLMSAATPDASPELASHVFKFFLKLFLLADKRPREAAVEKLCSSLAGLADAPQAELEAWLGHLVKGLGSPI